MKRIIILEKGGGGFLNFKYALWMDVPSSRQSFYADPNKISAYALAVSSELTLLRTGSVTEIVDTITVDKNLALSDIQSALITQWQNRQNSVNSDNPWIRYGTVWDGTSWILGGVS